MTNKHKQLLNDFEKRTKDLEQITSQDNLTSEQYAEAVKVRDELTGLRKQIEHEQQCDQLRGDADQFRQALTKPAGGHQHVGTRRDGETRITRKTDRRGRIVRSLAASGGGNWSGKALETIGSPEYRAAFRQYLVFGDRIPDKHYRTLEVGLDPQGGYLAPVENIARLIQRKPTPTRVSGLVDTINTSRDAVSLPKVNYSGTTDDTDGTIYSTGFRATAVDENPTSDTAAQVSDTSVFGSVRVPNFTWMIEGVLTNNQVEDAMFDPMSWMDGKFSETVDLLKDNKIINGDGIKESAGLLVSPGGTDQPAVVVTGSASAITADGLLNLSEDVPEQYDDNCRFLFKKTSTGKAIRVLKDSNNRYLFGEGYNQSGLTPAREKTLNGYPITWSQFMPDPGSNKYPIIFGDFKGYSLINRVGYTVQVLREVAARRNQIIILGRFRFGGLCLEPWRLRVQKCST